MSPILPFLDAVAAIAQKHGFASAAGYRHDAKTDNLHVELAYADGAPGHLDFTGQLVSDFDAPERRAGALVAVEAQIVALAKATP